ncbi:MAG: hypothetical protein LAO05_17545 [Acidobacteriia bacterium]|nr:hypothetical protein [Terriglobia bacterium]
MRATLAAVAVALVSAAFAAAEAPLTNSDIVKLVKAGVSAETIIAKIQTSETAFATDTDSLVALAGEKVPNSVIQAMMARSAAPTAVSTAVPAPAPAAAPEMPRAEVTQVVVKGIYRTRGICTARGELTMTPQKFAFKAVEKSPLCSEDAFGKSSTEFAWDDLSRICFEYAATGAVQIWLKDGQDMSFKATRAEIEDLAARMKSLRPDLPIRCDD